MTRITVPGRAAASNRGATPMLRADSNTRSRPYRACSLTGVSARFAERVVLRHIDLHVGPNDRIAVVGDNGAGKSTLLGLLSGAVQPFDGDRLVELPGGIAVAEQQPEFSPGATVADALEDRLAELRSLQAGMIIAAERIAEAGPDPDPGLLDRYAEQIARFEARDGYGAEHRLSSALDRLGLAGLDRSRRVAELSGGQRARLVLAAAVAVRPELLLLDEPTNDLDDAGLAWLDGEIARHRGALVVVSHDRAFLERFATDIVSVGDRGMRRTGNGYAGYLAERAAERRRLMAEHAQWAAELARQEAIGDANAERLREIPRKMARAGFGHGSFRARSRVHGAMSRVRTARERAGRLRADPVPRPADPLRFEPGFGPGSGPGGEPGLGGARASEAPACDVQPADGGAPGEPVLLSLAGVRVEDGPARRLSLDALEVRAGERWLVSGANGAGKSTLLDALAGELRPTAGTVARAPGVRIARLRQRITDPRSTGSAAATAVFAASTGTHPEEATAELLRLGLLGPEDLVRPLSELSVGQRRRLELAIAVSVPSDVLLLDEPTNHLAPELVEQLEEALLDYPGAVITVTHDRLWRERAERGGLLRRIDVASGGRATICAPAGSGFGMRIDGVLAEA